ncbi:MAG: hypothetical protein IPG04_01740 [Polyangiaceae bacterium]|jgi:hypothetical protein|nr:hypothetical protein [Polyangiaceae bacterium]
MSLRVVRCEALASHVFAEDQPRLYRYIAGRVEAFQKELGARGAGFIDSERPSVELRGFRLKLSESREIEVKQATIAEVEIAAVVYGETGDAIDAVNELWSLLGRLAGEDEENGGLAGGWAYKTTIVFTCPDLLRRRFGGIELIRDYMNRDGPGVRASVTDKFHLDVFGTTTIHGLQVPQAFVFEPRLASKPEDDVYYTSSPLRSETHRALLEALAREDG